MGRDGQSDSLELDGGLNIPRRIILYFQTASSMPCRDFNVLSQVPITFQEGLHVRSCLDSIHQLLQTRVFLQTLPSVLRQLFVMTDLIDDQVGIGYVLPNNIRTRGKLVIS